MTFLGTMKALCSRFRHDKSVSMVRPIRVALIIDEYFGAAGTAYGGYGYLARYYIAKYIPNDDIQIDVLLGRSNNFYFGKLFRVDNTNVYFLPWSNFLSIFWIWWKRYDIYLSIELTNRHVLKNVYSPHKRLILWIQDPRPMYEWDEINTVNLHREESYYNQRIYDLVHNWHKKDRVKLISQARFLDKKAIDLYRLPGDTKIDYLPNPVEIDLEFDIHEAKKETIIFLGRIESVKRGWLFCEIAKAMPHYRFFVLGQTFREKERNQSIIGRYQDIPNLSFEGLVSGEKKSEFLRNAKILVNTSIHEALPLSFLEALSFGVLLVSNRNPDGLTERFGIHVGDVQGDGFDKVHKFVDAIDRLMTETPQIKQLRRDAIEYVKSVHSIDRFVSSLRRTIYDEYVVSIH